MAAKQLERLPNLFCCTVADLQQSQRTKASLCHYEEEPGRRSAAKMVTKDEARRIAANFAKLPSLLSRQ
jgi:hypothetical protein